MSLNGMKLYEIHSLGCILIWTWNSMNFENQLWNVFIVSTNIIIMHISIVYELTHNETPEEKL